MSLIFNFSKQIYILTHTMSLTKVWPTVVYKMDIEVFKLYKSSDFIKLFAMAILC